MGRKILRMNILRSNHPLEIYSDLTNRWLLLIFTVWWPQVLGGGGVQYVQYMVVKTGYHSDLV